MDHVIKCVMVGDSMVGKTHMWLRYGTNKIPKEILPTIHDTYTISLPVNDKQVYKTFFTIQEFDIDFRTISRKKWFCAKI